MTPDKYYVEIVETNGEYGCEYPSLQYDRPFDIVDEAKAWADKAESHGSITIYRCADNLLTPILNNNFGWAPIEVKP